MHVDDVNLADNNAFTQGTPHDYFAFLRAEAPVTRHTRPDGSSFWSVVRYADIAAIEADFARFTSTRHGNPIPTGEAVEQLFADQILIFMDPPRHTAFRRILSRAFTPRACTRLEESAAALAAEAVDAVIEAGSCDFLDVAAHVPVQMIAEILGVPRADRGLLLRWTLDLFGQEDPELSNPEQFMSSMGELFIYANELAARRRAEPADDIFSTVVNADEDGFRLSDTELGLFFMLLATAGNETTRNLILQGTRLLIEHPDVADRLRKDASLVPNAVEEMLRFASPVHCFGRGTTTEVVLHGQAIPAGEQVMLWYASGNRDEATFDDPDVFDIDRPNAKRHMAFGPPGPHHCLGAALGRTEARVVFTEILHRMHDLELDGEPRLLRSNFTNGIVRMPVRFTPGPRINTERARGLASATATP